MPSNYQTIDDLINYIKECIEDIPELYDTDYVNGQRDALEQLLRDIESDNKNV